MDLELPDTSYTVNAWSKTHVDVVAEMDMLEHDPPNFGIFQNKLKATTIISKFASGVGTLLTEFELGVDTLLTELVQGLTAPTTSNSTNSRINSGADTGEKEHIDSGNVESPLMRKGTESCDKTLSGHPSAQFDTKSLSGATSHLNLPSDSDVCSSENNSPTDTLVNSQELEEKIRGSAAGLANRLCELKITRPTDTERDSGIT
ncbi:hypothetical protein D1007_56997 [Hordeum vulgare]|nr:hypothetical protein D1007_56997 [Hordeum vulgare]